MPKPFEHLVKRLNSEGEKTIAFFQALALEDWEQTLYTEGACWSVRQVMAHFIGAEASLRQLIEDILAGGEGAPEDFDLDAYNERRVDRMEGAQTMELMDQFAKQRQETIDLAAGMGAEELSKVGRHPSLGVTSVEDIFKRIYLHNQIHQRDVRKFLAEQSPERAG